jgi:hypothetical protein
MNNEINKNRSNYVPLRNFGTSLSTNLRTDPIGFSIYRDIDSFFDEGSLARTFGPKNKTSQLYMAEKCSKNWDGACELLSRNNETSVVNLGKVDSPVFKTPETSNMSIGDFLIENSAQRRFCNLDTCSIDEELYNINDPTSPLVKEIGGNSCIPVCTPPQDPDKDILLNKILNQPHKHIDLLLNMYHNCKNNRESYKNTRIDKIFNLFELYFSKYC